MLIRTIMLIGSLTSFLPWQHHLLHLGHLRFISLFEFFDSVGIPQGVESVFAGTASGRNVADHDCLAVADEGVAQNQS